MNKSASLLDYRTLFAAAASLVMRPAEVNFQRMAPRLTFSDLQEGDREREREKSQFPRRGKPASLSENTLCSFQRLVPPDVLTQRHLAITLFALAPLSISTFSPPFLCIPLRTINAPPTPRHPPPRRPHPRKKKKKARARQKEMHLPLTGNCRLESISCGESSLPLLPKSLARHLCMAAASH